MRYLKSHTMTCSIISTAKRTQDSVRRCFNQKDFPIQKKMNIQSTKTGWALDLIKRNTFMSIRPVLFKSEHAPGNNWVVPLRSRARGAGLGTWEPSVKQLGINSSNSPNNWCGYSGDRNIGVIGISSYVIPSQKNLLWT